MDKPILYKHHNYLDKTHNCIIGLPIRVYDMKSGGYSILKKNNLLSEKEIEYLDSLDKFNKNYVLGNMIRDNNWTEVLMKGFIDSRKRFMYYNNLVDDDILSIKKDAFFLLNTSCNNLEFDGYTWRLEDVYSSYYYINDKEFYFSNKNFNIELKGINDELLKRHKDFFLYDLCNIMKLNESTNTRYKNKYIQEYRSTYLNKELDIGCYRNLDEESMYVYKDRLCNQIVFVEDTNDIDCIDISYNYINYLLPLFRMIF